MKMKLRVRRPLHHGSLASRAPVVPLPRCRGGGKSQRSHNAIRVGGTCQARCELREILFAIDHSPLAFPFLHKRRKEAERRQTLIRILRILRCGSRLHEARSSDGVPPRLSPKGIIPSQRLSFRPGFLGLGLNGRYPPSPVPVQGCTSHPGHNAGRHDAQAAREQLAKPPAGTALAPMTRCASASCPSLERGLQCNCNRDACQEAVS
jgi:hypothetical protein